jgi:hypothetical protein
MGPSACPFCASIKGRCASVRKSGAEIAQFLLKMMRFANSFPARNARVINHRIDNGLRF